MAIARHGSAFLNAQSALYQFDGDALDSSGNGKHLTGGVPTFGDIFPGFRGLVPTTLGATPRLTAFDTDLGTLGDITFLMLLVAASPNSGIGYVFSHAASGETEAANNIHSLRIEDLELTYFSERGAGIDIPYALSIGVVTGPINHVALVRSSNQLTGYVNAIAGPTSVGLLAPTGGGSGRFTVGSFASGASNRADMGLASLKVLPGQVLTQPQIEQEWLATIGSEFPRISP